MLFQRTANRVGVGGHLLCQRTQEGGGGVTTTYSKGPKRVGVGWPLVCQRTQEGEGGVAICYVRGPRGWR